MLDVINTPQTSAGIEESLAGLCPEAARRVPVSLNIEQLAPDQRLQTDPRQEATVAVVEGVLYAAVGDDEQVLTPGDQIKVPAGAPRSIWNAGDELARAITGCTPV